MAIEFMGKPMSYYALKAPIEEVEKIRKIYDELEKNPVLEIDGMFNNQSKQIRDLEIENKLLKDKIKNISRAIEDIINKEYKV